LLTDLQQSSIAELTDLSAKMSALSLRYRTVSTSIASLHQETQRLTETIDSVHAVLDATETESFDYQPAEDVLKRLKKLAGQITMFETEVVHHHDDELYDQTDAAVNAMADSKEHLQRLMQTVQNEIGELEDIIKKENPFYWSYVLTAVLGLAVLCNCYALVPTDKVEVENEP
jgi:prefoldin subunit 5